MSDESTASPQEGVLERRYRRLLGLYPPAWRAARLEEVLAVLLACAEPGRSRPGVRDAADLLRHALVERVRPTGRSLSPDDRRSGVALAGIVAFALLAAVSVLQLIVLAPNPDAWGTYQFSTGYGTGPGVAMLASAAALVAGGCWLARRRRLAIVAIALADVGFLIAALQVRNNGNFAVPWVLLTGILGLAVVATILLVVRGVSDAGREMIGARGALELTAAFVLVAEVAQWRYIAWGSMLYGPGGATNPNYHAVPHTVLIAYLLAAAAALAVARRNPVPLIAATVLSPLLLVGGIVELAQSWVFHNADVAVHFADDAVPAGVVALLAAASVLATRRSRPA
jgi:hypothetical protein